MRVMALMGILNIERGDLWLKCTNLQLDICDLLSARLFHFLWLLSK